MHGGQVTTMEESGVEEVNESKPEQSQCFKKPTQGHHFNYYDAHDGVALGTILTCQLRKS